MAHQVRWNDEVLNSFIKLGGLTPREKELMQLRVSKDCTLIQQADLLGVSESTANRITKRCKIKYDNCVKQYPEIFKSRVFENVWEQDTNNDINLK